MDKNNSIKLTIELTGVAKDIVGSPEIQLEFSQKDTYHDVVEKLAELYPALVNILIAPDKKTFLSSNLFIINDEMNDPVFFMDQYPKDGDRLTLVSVMTGG
jgi:molybdopterin converting factor small subunit